MALHPTLLKTLNVVSYTTAISTMSYYHKFIIDALAGHPNFLSNTHIGFLIPTINWFLLGGFTFLVQWFDSNHDVLVEAVDWHLFVSNFIITGWVLSWVRTFLSPMPFFSHEQAAPHVSGVSRPFAFLETFFIPLTRNFSARLVMITLIVGSQLSLCWSSPVDPERCFDLAFVCENEGLHSHESFGLSLCP